MQQEQSFDHLSSHRGRVVGLLLGLAAIGVLAATPILVEQGSGGLTTLGLLFLCLAAFGFFAVGHVINSGLIWQMRLRRVFRAVSRRVGLTIKDDKTGRPIYPALRRMTGTGTAWTALIVPLTGQTVGQWEKATDAFSLALGETVRIANNGDGTLTMKVGFIPLESVDTPVRGDPTDNKTWRQRLGAIPVAVTETGQDFALPAIDTHILVVGESGAGKGSVIWSTLIGLVPAIRAGTVRVWGLDPKIVELAIGGGAPGVSSGFFYRYASNTADMVAMLNELVNDMMTRASTLSGKTRKFEPSVEYPMNVIVIDELAYLSVLLPDKKLQAEANKAVQTLLVLGRATGYMVIGAAQDPRKEVLSMRDMYPTRVALRMKSGMVDLVLGSGARAEGAYCDQIPDPREGGAGVAYVMGEGSHIPQKVRFTWPSDELIQRVAADLDAAADNKPDTGDNTEGE